MAKGKRGKPDKQDKSEPVALEGRSLLEVEMKRLQASTRVLESTSTTLDGWATWVRGLLGRPSPKR